MAQLKRYNGSSWERVGGSVVPKTSTTTSDTDTYSCNYVNGLNTYTNAEKRVGTWTDGKPLYRRTLTFPNNGGGTGLVTYTLSNYGITNVDTIFIVHPSYYSNTNGATYPFQYNDGNAFECNVTSTKLNIRLGYAPISGCQLVITLEYTKTTD